MVSFVDEGGADLADCSGTIDWGDGTSGSATLPVTTERSLSRSAQLQRVLVHCPDPHRRAGCGWLDNAL